MPRRTRADYEAIYPFVLYNYSLSFRVHHPTMPATEARAGLRMRPHVTHSVGKQRRDHRGNPLPGAYRQTYLSFKIKTRPGEELPDAIQRTLDRLRKRSTFLDNFRSTGGKLDFFIGIFVDRNKGVTFDVELMQELAEMGIELGLDIYGSAIPSSTPPA